MDPYELAMLSQTTMRLPFLSYASCTSWLRAPMCSKHPENTLMPPFWMYILIYLFWVIYAVILLASMEKKLLHSTLSKENGPKLADICQVLFFGDKAPICSPPAYWYNALGPDSSDKFPKPSKELGVFFLYVIHAEYTAYTTGTWSRR